MSVSVSNPFFAWVVGFIGDMTIEGPADVKEEYKVMLLKGLEGNSNASETENLEELTALCKMATNR